MHRRYRTTASDRTLGPLPRWPVLILAAVLAAACQANPEATGEEVLDFADIAAAGPTIEPHVSGDRSHAAGDHHPRRCLRGRPR